MKASGEYENLRSAFLEAEHRAEPQKAGFRLQNPENQLQAEFQNGTVTIQHPNGRLGLRLRSYGYRKRMRAPSPAAVHAAGTRIEYRRGLLTEWYANEARGLEQGFTFDQRPDASADGPLMIELAVSGSLQPVLAGEHIELRQDSRSKLLYTGLRAWDATGRALDARMAVRAEHILLQISDAGAIYPITIDPWIQQQKLTASDGALGDDFGFSVSVDGDTAVVGARSNTLQGGFFQGAAYVFTRSGTAWTQQQKLTALDAGSGDAFGYSVYVNGDTAIIGAPAKNSDQGAAYVFTRSGSTWTQQQKLTASDAATGDQLGWSVSLNLDTAVIGAFVKNIGPNAHQGAAYVFVRSGATWTQQQELTSSDGATNDEFGYAVSVKADTTVIGAGAKNSIQGAAYVFTRSGSTWTQQAKLTASDAANSDFFGASVSLDGDTTVIGAEDKNSAQGAAYVFTRSGSTWTQQQKLTPSDVATGDHFGNSVSLSVDAVLIGAPLKNSAQGAAYVFTRSGSTWTQQQELAVSDGLSGDAFGVSVALDGLTAVVGALNNPISGGGVIKGPGAAYVFVQPPDLTITKTHTGTFALGGTGSYTITVANSGAGVTVGTVTVVDTLMAGLTATAISGTGWTCTLATLTCTRSDALGAGSSYPAITVSVNVAVNAATSATNTAIVSGGGESNTANDSATDVTTIAPALVITPINSLASASSFRAATFAFNVTLASGVSLGTVAFSCSGLPSGGVCAFSPPSVTQSSQVTMTVSPSNLGLAQNRMLGPVRSLHYFFALMMLPFLGLVPMATTRDRRTRQYGMWLLLLFLVLLLTGCGYNQSNPLGVIPAGSYNIMVTATSSTGQQAQSVVTVIVQ
ncbi:MAG: hypothetical protein ACR2IF_07930 [Terriglobales bacterium]